MKAVHGMLCIFSGVVFRVQRKSFLSCKPVLKQQLVAPNLEDLNKNIDNIIISLFYQVLRK